MIDKKSKIKTTPKLSPEPNDGTFISPNTLDSFSCEGTVRYGEETDVDDI